MMGLVSSVKGKMVMRQKLARSGMKREAKKREEGGRRRVSNSKNENQQPTIMLCTGSTYCIGFSGSQSYFNHVAQSIIYCHKIRFLGLLDPQFFFHTVPCKWSTNNASL